MESWDYNCPKFVDFTKCNEGDSMASEYFDVDHESQDLSDSVFSQPTSPTKDAVNNTQELADKVLSQPTSANREDAEHQCANDNMQSQSTMNDVNIQVPEKLAESLMSGFKSGSRSKEPRRYSLRPTARLRQIKSEPEGGAAKKQKKGNERNVMSPLILCRSPSQLRKEAAHGNRSVSMPRKRKSDSIRKRHVSETRTSVNKDTKAKKASVTRVQPFHFATDKRIKGPEVQSREMHKRKHPQENAKFISLAEQILAFQNEVPDRYKSESRESSKTLHHQTSVKLELTHPKTPRLRTSLRARPTQIKSQQDKEKEEMSEIKSYRFRARPFNSRIMIHTLGVPMVKSKTPTKPLDIHLATDKRAGTWKKNDQKEDVFHFKAKPAPKTAPVRAKAISSVPATEPKSPAFALKLRHEAWQKHQEEMAAKEADKLQNAAVRKTTANGPPPPSPFMKRPTIPEPFSFDAADKRRFAKKEAKIKEVLEQENEMHVFHANPMPSPSPALLPKKPTVACTKPSPFQMLVDQRGQKKNDHPKHVEEDLQKMKEMVTFKAQPAIVLTKEPFKPEKADKPLTETTNIVLNTEKRASLREKYDEKRRQQESEMEVLKAAREAEQEQKEKEAILELRTKAVHKAQRAPRFDHPLHIKPSEKPLTQPHSPKFSTRLTKS